MINISEDVDLAFEINHQNNVGQDYLGKLSSTIRQVAETENAQEILEHLNVVPVLTAHPTQVQRKTMLDLNHSHSQSFTPTSRCKSWLDERNQMVQQFAS